MKAEQSDRSKNNFLLNLHPFTRILISVIIAAAGYLLVRYAEKPLVAGIFTWCIFSLTYLSLCWYVLFKRGIDDITRVAKKDDGSALFVFVIILLSSFASLVMVIVLITSKGNSSTDSYVIVACAIAILLSWMMVHTTYSFHYAHLYYDDDVENSQQRAGGLDFPGKGDPEYLDFAYFAFVIGMTFQVSDVQITSPVLRRKALAHGLISFVLNTIVVALTINLIGSK